MKDEVKRYYGQVLQQTGDLKTSACCTADQLPDHLREMTERIHPEVSGRYYGCGLVAPEKLEGMRILDLGSGSGRDCYLLAQLVGPQGFVVGVDMTDEQLAVANRHLDWHRDRFGYAKSNVEFRKGYIERLEELGLPEESFDIIVSNCVINLSPDKAAVLRGAWKLLKPGGELYFSDVYADRRIPPELAQDPVLYGECLSGALYWWDFLRLARDAGFVDPRLVEDRVLALGSAEIEAKIGHIHFFSAGYRLFKLDGLEESREDYGQRVRYRGDIPHHPDGIRLDKQTWLVAGQETPVCGNSYRILGESRLGDHFDFNPGDGVHRGVFPGTDRRIPFDAGLKVGLALGGCCS